MKGKGAGITFVLEHVPAEEGLGNREVPQTGVGGVRPWRKEWENRGFSRSSYPVARAKWCYDFVMSRFISVVRIFYTAVLLLLGLAVFIWTMVSIAAAGNDHAPFNIFSFTNLVIAVLFISLLVSRILYSHSPKWLWLGLPSILVIAGFAGYIFLSLP